jgi:hypothetical protein
MHFREIEIYNALGAKIPGSRMTAAMSSEYKDIAGQSFQGQKCLDGDVAGSSWGIYNLCHTYGPASGDPYPWMRFG